MRLEYCVCTGGAKCGVIGFKIIFVKGTKDSSERTVIFLCALVMF